MTTHKPTPHDRRRIARLLSIAWQAGTPAALEEAQKSAQSIHTPAKAYARAFLLTESGHRALAKPFVVRAKQLEREAAHRSSHE